ncbi:MAG TPA: hypothetical protein VFS05_05295 [Gemmatimonadaceae bacterium]|nr:hypothetical protein [Gemmatimonadaceae bacterium]
MKHRPSLPRPGARAPLGVTLSLLAVALAAPSAGAQLPDERTPREFSIEPLRYGAYAGTVIPLAVRGEPADSVLWLSSRADMAFVSEHGALVLLAPGPVTLEAHARGKTRELRLDVKANPVERVELTTDERATVRTGDTVRISAELLAPGGERVTDARVHFAIASRGLLAAPAATVSEDGLFVAREPGLYTVIAACGRAAAAVTIAVESRQGRYAAAPAPAGDITIEGPRYEALVGTALPLRAEVSGAGGARDIPVVWHSSQPNVAQVDDRGVVIFQQPGRVTITAEAGARRASRSFVVRDEGAAHMALSVDGGDTRVGDAVRLHDELWQPGGHPVRRVRTNYGVVAQGSETPVNAAAISEDRVFTAREPGTYTIIAEFGGRAEQTTIVVRPRAASARD